MFAHVTLSEYPRMTLNDSRVLASIDGWKITTPDLGSAVHDIIAAAKESRAFTVVMLNLDHLVKLRANSALRTAYRNACIVTADSAPVAWLARAQHTAIQRTKSGALVVPLAEAAAEAQLPVFLFGTSARMLARAARDLGERTDGLLDISGTLAPSANFDPQSAEADAAIAKIQLSGAKLCLIALAAPQQEIFAERARSQGIDCGFVCLGQSLDQLALQTQAPKALRGGKRGGLAHLLANPGLMARSYLDCAALFLDLTLFAPFRPKAAHPRG